MYPSITPFYPSSLSTAASRSSHSTNIHKKFLPPPPPLTTTSISIIHHHRTTMHSQRRPPRHIPMFFSFFLSYYLIPSVIFSLISTCAKTDDEERGRASFEGGVVRDGCGRAWVKLDMEVKEERETSRRRKKKKKIT